MTLDLQASPADQDALLAWARTLLPALAPLTRCRLDAEDERPGLRIEAGDALGGEVECGVAVEAGALVIELEAVRGKAHVLGVWHPSAKISRTFWGPKARAMVGEMGAKLPPGWSLTADAGPRYVRLAVEGLSFERVLISETRLLIEVRTT